ncbi:MAG: lytic transglycosylase F [Bacteroidetes bacterium GWC2_33_15]|nr:MAG: lytic transglycosylase F [Bacteroidetes bacterium GWA2_33_15]OFX50207.1 MAG: lytic transglycosylase F [Bacteroidetes bacterium GWC2_33_15]OFX65359.1 MAG: lytic transglycosylase F [Bacteroidetes bacterium GWB2_32_14]OFX70586.1 MAG: lytic transglycosylase F [Bacteroidetes bacterium GWD2_33_33]HAN19537.1 lytic transglycosylase F [Bacteroidales bacterium]
MKEITSYFRLFLLIIAAAVIFMSCNQSKNRESKKLNSLELVKKQGKLVAVTDYNSTNYFIYRGEPMGYQYELLNLLANHLGVKLEVMVNNDISENFKMLSEKKCDIIAINLTITKERSQNIDFTIPHSQTRQVLVQKKPDNWEKISAKEIESMLIRNQLDLAGKTVHVQKESSYATRIKSLSDEIGDSIKIIEMVDLEVEQLIELVAKGEIEYTIADENVALVNQTYFPAIDVQTAISFPQNLAWGLRKDDDSLRVEINKWLEKFKSTSDYIFIYNKYFRNRRSVKIVGSDYYSISSGKISMYDDFIKEYNYIIDWDWRLIASLMYQESKFNPTAESWAGAYGLMQLMPTTAKRFGVDKKSLPKQNIKAGIRLIKWIDTRFVNLGIKDKDERIKFVLASYNVGVGHVLDARRLAEKHGKDPNTWDNNVAEYILRKSNPRYYNDPVVEFGYCRGDETFNYVFQIIDRYEHYKNFIPED